MARRACALAPTAPASHRRYRSRLTRVILRAAQDVAVGGHGQPHKVALVAVPSVAASGPHAAGNCAAAAHRRAAAGGAGAGAGGAGRGHYFAQVPQPAEPAWKIRES